MYYINKNYVLNPIYNDENECINDTLSLTLYNGKVGVESSKNLGYEIIAFGKKR